MLREIDVSVLGDIKTSSMAVHTIVLPLSVGCWHRAGKERIFLLSFRSACLLRLNHKQICLMGEYAEDDLQALGMLDDEAHGDIFVSH